MTTDPTDITPGETASYSQIGDDGSVKWTVLPPAQSARIKDAREAFVIRETAGIETEAESEFGWSGETPPMTALDALRGAQEKVLDATGNSIAAWDAAEARAERLDRLRTDVIDAARDCCDDLGLTAAALLQHDATTNAHLRAAVRALTDEETRP
ncbi:hypothetical protein GCM10025865_00870 [Paraoerskovia sediminicola]|uniref:Uncharacterized protein n=1 Tax=Paraoerskovia sediminicola TaxID=1138587 RepID=A0ABM8FYH9_9CELL|nr:hypothetical protein [Paraoerskovia sediminicola]BDZ40788.1 hypothetical protein GCM10025865_00870 [Paraoerskovia sediminicola]